MKHFQNFSQRICKFYENLNISKNPFDQKHKKFLKSRNSKVLSHTYNLYFNLFIQRIKFENIFNMGMFFLSYRFWEGGDSFCKAFIKEKFIFLL